MTDGGWLLIAEFARRCRLPVSTLRYYDRIGLLRPAMVDRDSGYRRYAAEQLPSAVSIQALRAIGTAPEAIAVILAGGEAARLALSAEQRRVSAQVAERTKALTRLAELSSAYRAAPTDRALQLVELPACTVPVLAFTAPYPALTATIIQTVTRLRRQLRGHGIRAGSWGAMLPLDLGDEVTGHVFARCDVPTGSLLTRQELPAGLAVQARHAGHPDGIGLAYAAVFAEIARRGAQPLGPVIEDYPNAPVGGSLQLTIPMGGLTR